MRVGIDHNGHEFVVPPPRALASMTLAEIDASVCWNYHLDEPLDAKSARLLRAALGLTQEVAA